MNIQAQISAEQNPLHAKLAFQTSPTHPIPKGEINNTVTLHRASSPQIPKAQGAPDGSRGFCEWEAEYHNITPPERMQWTKQALSEIHKTMVSLRKIQYERGLRCYHLGKYDKALRYFTWAENYNANAQYLLGRMYESGLGVPRDTHAALSWYRKAARQGHEEALSKLGMAEEENAQQKKTQNPDYRKDG